METAESASGEPDLRKVMAVCAAICERRELLPYLVVARAMFLLAQIRNEGEARRLAEGLGISRQTRHNWLKRDLVAWLDHWEQRLVADPTASDGRPTRKHTVVTEDDWDWIAGLFANYGRMRWDDVQARIHRAAKENPVRLHLAGLHRTTLWRNRKKLRDRIATIQRTRNGAGGGG